MDLRISSFVRSVRYPSGENDLFPTSARGEGAVKMRTGELVAVVDFTDYANEDHWAQATWTGEVAARNAAEQAGYAKEQLARSFPDFRTIALTAPDGCSFAAVLHAQPDGPYWGIARPPTERDLGRTAGPARTGAGRAAAGTLEDRQGMEADRTARR